MSRNFDILQNAAQFPGVFPPSAAPGAKINGGAHPPAATKASHACAKDEVVKLVQRIFILPGDTKAPGAVAFCGIGRGDGCSWVCAHAGEVLADQVAGNVCLVDANLRSPSLHDYFDLANVPGFADAAKDPRPMRDFARRASGKNLWLISAGTVGREPNGALNPVRLQTRMAELRGEFEYVLIDTPPLSAFNDAILVGQATDGIVLVVGSHSTRRQSARMAKESLDSAGVKMFGAVLNQRTFPIPERIYRKL